MDRRDTFFLESIVKYIDAKTVVEIGVQQANMAVHLCRAAKENGGQYLGFDIWAVHGLRNQFTGYTGTHQDACNKLIASGLDNFTFTQIDTFEADAFNKHLDRLCPDGIDFAFIDACHSYAGIANDFKAVYKRMTPRGVIAFHDTAKIDGCREFILDLRTKYNDGSFDIMDFPFGEGDRYCGVTLLNKRPYAITDIAIDEICGSYHSCKEIETLEKEWYTSQLKSVPEIPVEKGQMEHLDKVGYYPERKKYD